MAEAADGEEDVGEELIPQAQPARVARRFLLRFDSAEFDSRRSLGRRARQAAPLEVVGAEGDVAPELRVHLALERGTSEQVAQQRSCAEGHRSHSDSGVARNAADMAATIWSQLDRSSRSCFRPAGVSV